MAHIIRENAGKKLKTISELFINKHFEYTFVLFVSNKSLRFDFNVCCDQIPTKISGGLYFCVERISIKFLSSLK